MVIMIRRSKEWWELRGQGAVFSCLSVCWFLDRVRWQPAHHPLALGAAPKGINQLAVSTQILANVMVIHVLRKQQAHTIIKQKTPAIFEHIRFEKALYLCRGSNWILGGGGPVIYAVPHLYLYWLEAAVRKSMMGIGSAGWHVSTVGKLSFTALCSLIKFHLLF